MKKYLLVLLCLLCFLQAKAQMPVTDAAHIKAQASSWATQLARMYTQLELMQESEGYLLEGINFYLKIQDKIKNSVLVFKILESQYNLVEIAHEALTMPDSEIGSEVIYTKYKTIIMEILEKNNHNAEMTASFIKEGVFKMNDAERLAAAEQLEKRTNELYSQIFAAKKHFDSVNYKSLLIKRLEN